MIAPPAGRSATPAAVPTAEVRIADRLRQLRTDKGLTLRQLASAAGISQAFLSRVENHKVSLTIAGLEQLAGVLGVPLATFFEEDKRTLPIALCRAGKGSKGRLRGPKGFPYEMLASAKRGKLMEPLLLDVGHLGIVPPLKSHPGEEFNFVVEGECTLLYGKERIHLRTGDAAYYDASVPHTTHAIKGKPCKLLAVVASRDYLFHGDLSRLMNEPANGGASR